MYCLALLRAHKSRWHTLGGFSFRCRDFLKSRGPEACVKWVSGQTSVGRLGMAKWTNDQQPTFQESSEGWKFFSVWAEESGGHLRDSICRTVVNLLFQGLEHIGNLKFLGSVYPIYLENLSGIDHEVMVNSSNSLKLAKVQKVTLTGRTQMLEALISGLLCYSVNFEMYSS